MRNVLAVLGLAGVLALVFAGMMATIPDKMPVSVAEGHLGAVLDPDTDGCQPHRGTLTQSGNYCVLKILEPGWHEVNLTKYRFVTWHEDAQAFRDVEP